MENTKYRLPEREWYSLEGAIKEIKKKTGEELEIIDLLHFWNMGKLDLSVKIHISPFFIEIAKNSYRKKDIMHFDVFDDFDTLLNETDKFKNLLVIMSKAEANESIKFFEDKNNFKDTLAILSQAEENELSKISEEKDSVILTEADEEYLILGEYDNQAYFLSGFFSILPDDDFKSFKSDLRQNRILLRAFHLAYKNLTDNREIKEDNAAISIFISFKESGKEQEISLDEIFITKDHLEQFLTGETNINLKEEREKFNQPKPISKPVQENQIAFIKTLLFMHYGVKTAEEARQLLRNSGKWDKFKREHAAEIEALNLKIPSDNTLQNWYRNS